MDECNVCGEKSIVNEEDANGNIRVCLECGAVNEEIEVLTSDKEFRGTTLSDGIGRAPQGVRAGTACVNADRKPPGLDFGKRFIQKIGQEANFTDHMVSDAEELYERAIDEVYKMSDDVKSAMCVACLYCVARINHRGITLGDFLALSHADRQKGLKRAGNFLKILKTKFEVHLPACCVGSQVGEMLLRDGMSSKVCEMAKQIVLCMELALITQGRPASIFVHAAAYYACRACEFDKYKKISFQAFLTKKGVPLTCIMRRTKSEMETALTAMVKELPWVQASSYPIKDITPYLQDALKYKTSLMSLAFRTAIEKLTAGQESESTQELTVSVDQPNVEEKPTELIETELNAQNDGTAQTSDINEMRKEPGMKIENKSTVHVFRKTHRRKKRKPNVQEKELSPRKKLKYSEMFKDDNSDSDISLGSDDDTEDYVFTPEQVTNRMMLFNKFKNTN